MKVKRTGSGWCMTEVFIIQRFNRPLTFYYRFYTLLLRPLSLLYPNLSTIHLEVGEGGGKSIAPKPHFTPGL